MAWSRTLLLATLGVLLALAVVMVVVDGDPTITTTHAARQSLSRRRLFSFKGAEERRASRRVRCVVLLPTNIVARTRIH